MAPSSEKNAINSPAEAITRNSAILSRNTTRRAPVASSPSAASAGLRLCARPERTWLPLSGRVGVIGRPLPCEVSGGIVFSSSVMSPQGDFVCGSDRKRRPTPKEVPDAAGARGFGLSARWLYFFLPLLAFFLGGVTAACVMVSVLVWLAAAPPVGVNVTVIFTLSLCPLALASLLSAALEIASVTVPLPPEVLALTLPTVTPAPVALTCTLPASGSTSDRTMSLPLTFALAIEKALLGSAGLTTVGVVVVVVVTGGVLTSTLLPPAPAALFQPIVATPFSASSTIVLGRAA